MDINVLLKEEWFWAAIAAIATIAAVVGALLSWVIAAIIKHRERPEADWAITGTARAGTSLAWHGLVGIHVGGAIANAGDGSAFDIKIEGTKCSASFPDRVPLLAPGDTAKFDCMIPLDGWHAASITLTWTRSPTRLRKTRSITFAPSDLADMPAVTYLDKNMDEVDEVTWKELHASGEA